MDDLHRALRDHPAYTWSSTLRSLAARWVDAGFGKLFVRPIEPPAERARLADTVVDLQT